MNIVRIQKYIVLVNEFSKNDLKELKCLHLNFSVNSLAVCYCFIIDKNIFDKQSTNSALCSSIENWLTFIFKLLVTAFNTFM